MRGDELESVMAAAAAHGLTAGAAAWGVQLDAATLALTLSALGEGPPRVPPEFLRADGTALWTVGAKGCKLREGLALRTAAVGRLEPGSQCVVAEERVCGRMPRVHVVWPLDGWATPRLTGGVVLLRRNGGSRVSVLEELTRSRAKAREATAAQAERVSARVKQLLSKPTALSQVAFWEENWRSQPTEWCDDGGRAQFGWRSFLWPHVNPSQLVLNLGNGLSGLARDLHAHGIRAVVHTDVVAAITEELSARHPELELAVVDGMHAHIRSGAFDVVIDKYCSDSLYCERDSSKPMTSALFREMWRVTRPGGRYLLMSLHHPTSTKFLMRPECGGWELEYAGSCKLPPEEASRIGRRSAQTCFVLRKPMP